MKKSNYLLILVALIIGLLAFNKEETISKKSFTDSFSNVLISAKAYTLEVAKEMPADQYKFRPNDSVRTFGEQMAHIAMTNQMILTKFIKGEDMKLDFAEGHKMEIKLGSSKEECIKILEKSFDNAIKTLEGINEKDLNETFVFMFDPKKPEFTKQEGFVFFRDHITHHRGQAIIYLRMKGFKPPSYRAF